MTEQPRLDAALDICPLIAILRGITLEEVEGVADALIAAGFTVLEVPLNSPRPFQSVERLARHTGGRVLVGTGTVMSEADVRRTRDAGGRLIVMPHSDAAVIAAAKTDGLWCTPGVATPSEAFAALAAGADALKLFPAEALPPAVVKAWRAVLPSDIRLLPVGSIRPDTMSGYLAAGANGFGIGSALYKPGKSAADVGADARRFVAAWRKAVPT